MDSLTQAVLGAGIQGVGLGKVQGRKAYLYGAALATIPDLDVVIPYADPLTAMTSHRGFSHSIFVLSVLAALLTWLIIKYRPLEDCSRWRVFTTLWLVLVTHPVLDSFTVYGTQLFWPLPFVPESWSAIFIIDPLFTLPLLLATIIGLVFGAKRIALKFGQYALSWALIYLTLALGFKVQATQKTQALFEQENITLTRSKTMAMPLTILLWRTLAEDEKGRRYEVISGVLDKKAPQWRRLNGNTEWLAPLIDDNPYYQRLRWFSDDWLAIERVNQALIVADQRMTMADKPIFAFKLGEYDGEHFVATTPTAVKREMRATKADIEALWRRVFFGESVAP